METRQRADIVVSILWIPMLPSDSATTAEAAVGLVPDARARHYFDAERRAGRAIADRMHGEGNIAWDMYLFYGPGATWEDEPPSPLGWAHQLTDDWADLTRCHRGEKLVAALQDLLRLSLPS